MSNLLIYAKQPYVVLAVAAGKLAEGVEGVRKGNSLISMVIMSGIPFSPPSKDKEIVRRAMTHAARDKKAAKQFMMQIPLERKVKQNQTHPQPSVSKRSIDLIISFDYYLETTF